MNEQLSQADFCIQIDFQKGSESPSRVFKSMAELIETFQRIDRVLIESIDTTIEPIVLIEDIQTGSLKAFLRYIISKIPDNAIEALDWKKAVGTYLVKGKKVILKWTADRDEVKNRSELIELEEGLLQIARETEVLSLPSYSKVNRQKLLPELQSLNQSLSYLSEADSAIFVTDESIRMNARFNIIPESIEALVTKEIIKSTAVMILKVKKPDYLGESQWEFRHGSRRILGSILDRNWLNDFQNRKVDVRPMDSLRARVTVEVNYGYDNEVVSERYFLVEIIEVIAGTHSEQTDLLV